MKTVRLTTAQALVRWLIAQRTVLMARSAPVSRCVRHLRSWQRHLARRGPRAGQEQLPTWRGQNEQSMALAGIAYSKAMRASRSWSPPPRWSRLHNMLTAAAVAPVNRLPVLMLSGDTSPTVCSTRCSSKSSAPLTRRLRVRRVQARRAVLGPDQPARADHPVVAPGARDDDGSGRLWAGVLRPPPGRPGGGVRLPRPSSSSEVPLRPSTGARSPRPRPCCRPALQCQQPLVIAGGGARYSEANGHSRRSPSADAHADRRDGGREGHRPWDHPHNVGTLGTIGSSSANAVAEEADVIVAVGTRLQDFTTGSWSVFATRSQVHPDQHHSVGCRQAIAHCARR